MQPHADHLGGLVGQGPDVQVLVEAGHADQARDDVRHLVDGVADLDVHDLAALRQALEVLLNLEQVQGLVVRVPVAANALEYAGAVVEGVRHDPDLRLGEGDNLPL